MRALVIYRIDISIPANYGVAIKLQGQSFGLVQNGFSVDSIYLNEEGLWKNEVKIKNVRPSKVARSLFKMQSYYQAVSSNVNAQDYDLVLIRHHLVFPGFIKMLEKFKKNNPKLKIVIDLPTYPYEEEWKKTLGSAVLSIDAKYRNRLSEFVDLIIHYGKDHSLFGIPCLQSSNGIIEGEHHYKRLNNKHSGIHLIAVGKWRYWHGLERVIIGLSNYYRTKQEEEIFLHIVGDGEEIPKYKAIVETEKIADKVIFYGGITGCELDRLLEQADIGIGTLALYKKNVFIDSSLKHRTYCQHGIPFILYNDDADFPHDSDFVYYVPHEGCIEMEEILQFFYKIERKEHLSERMMNYASQKLNWKSKMKRVIEELQLIKKESLTQ